LPAAQLLLDLIKDAHPEVRAAAYDSLGRIADGTCAGPMTSALEDTDSLGEQGGAFVREAASQALQHIGAGAIPALLRLAKNKNPRLRETAIAALAGIGGADAEPALVAALQDARSSVRQLAIQWLASNAASPVQALAAALAHRDAATRRGAVDALSEVTGPDVTGALARATRDTRQRTPEAIAALVGVFEGQDRGLRQLAAAGLKGVDWHPATPDQRALRAILAGDYLAAGAEGRPAVEPLAALLTDKSAAVRKAASEGLGATRDESAIKPLVSALQDHDPGVRRAAADALVAVGPASIGPLVSAVHELARAAAPDVVLAMGPPAVMPLLDVLDRGEPYTHDGAVTRRVEDDEEAERAERASQLLNRLLGHAAHDIEAGALARAAHLRDVVRVREVMPASKRESTTTVVETVVDCKDLRARADAERERRKVR
jgi:HEAT repeat protein